MASYDTSTEKASTEFKSGFRNESLEARGRLVSGKEFSNNKLKLLITIIIIIALVWGFIGSIELFILSSLQVLFPTRTNLSYSVMQILIYLSLLFVVIYFTDFDASRLLIFNSPE